jgi:hypothetical protein
MIDAGDTRATSVVLEYFHSQEKQLDYGWKPPCELCDALALA